MRVIQGDILTPVTDVTPTVVCHQVNCKGVMGSGLARQVRSKFPAVYGVYKEKCLAESVGHLLGSVQFCSVLAEAGYIIANVFAQDSYGRDQCYTDYNAMRNALGKIAEAFPHATVRIPYRMGCGLAGGDWAVVTGIIQDTLESKEVNVEIWKL